MRAAVAIALLCCALLAQAEARTDVSTLSKEARRGLIDDAINSAANKVVDWLRGTVQGSINNLKTTIENDVSAARTGAQNAVSSAKNTVLSSCQSTVDLAAGGINTFNSKIDQMRDSFKNEVNAIGNSVGVVKTLLEQFGRSLAAFFTAAFDVSDKPPACAIPKVFGEVNSFFQNYIGAQPLSSAMWCRFIGLAAKVKLDGAFQKLFTTQKPLFKSAAFLEVDSQTGESLAVSEEVLLGSVDWNVVAVVCETFDGAVDITSVVLAAMDQGPVEDAAVKAETGGVDPQLVVSLVAVVFKLVSSSLRAAAVAKGCSA